MQKTPFSDLRVESPEYGTIPLFPSVSPWGLHGGNLLALEGSAPFGIFVLNFLHADDYVLWRADFWIGERHELRFRDPSLSGLGISFGIQNNFYYRVEGLPVDVLERGHGMFNVIPEVDCTLFLHEGEYTAFGVFFSPAFLARWQEASPLLQTFMSQVRSGVPSRMCGEPIMATTPLYTLIERLLSTPLCGGVLPGLYVEARMLDLLRLSLTELTVQRDQMARSKLHEDDLKKIREVYRYYRENFARPEAFSIVARRVGMNTRKLENGFKELFHTTIARFVADLRLNHARKLIEETGEPIKIVMSCAGYDVLSSFSRAFKARFGVSPSSIPRSNPRQPVSHPTA